MNARRLLALVTLAALGALAVPGSSAADPPTPPLPTCTPGPADCHAWHTAAVVTVHWPAAPPGVIEEGCDPETITSDTPGLFVTCTWWESDLSSYATRGVSVRRDATPPSAQAIPNRGPDNNGWYNHGLTVDFSGSDALSGLAGCSRDRSYNGPDSGVAAVSGSCSDVAGNSRSASFAFAFDATPPKVEAKPDRGPDRKGWYNHKVRVDFVGTDATSGIGSCAPAVMYEGPDVGKAAVAGACTRQGGEQERRRGVRAQVRHEGAQPRATSSGGPQKRHRPPVGVE